MSQPVDYDTYEQHAKAGESIEFERVSQNDCGSEEKRGFGEVNGSPPLRNNLRMAIAEVQRLEDDAAIAPMEFTEVFAWGADRFGQLGLGEAMSMGRSTQAVPRLCSYNIPIQHVSCGARHSAFLTSKCSQFVDNLPEAAQLVYTMGSNEFGQLGIGEPCLPQKNTPMLVEHLLNQKPA